MAIYQKIYLVVHPMLSPKIWGLIVGHGPLLGCKITQSGGIRLYISVNFHYAGPNLHFPAFENLSRAF